MTSPYPEFRRRLDDVLSRRDPAALRAFLIAEGQWEASTATDPERAMWMMIATSPALRALHDEATRWLEEHGFTSEVRLLRRSEQPSKSGQRKGPRRPPSPGAPGRPRGKPHPPSAHSPRKP